MKLITISGLDGSGKSTQIKKLEEFLQSQGKNVYYFHSVTFSVANQILLRGKSAKEVRAAKARTEASWPQIFLRKIALLIDLWRFQQLYKKLSPQYDYLLSDRYFYDQVINILYLEHRTIPISPRWWQKLAAKSIIKPDNAFYLKVSPEQIMQRAREVEQGLQYLKNKEVLYNEISKHLNVTEIDGEKNPSEIFQNLLCLLKLI